MKKLDYHFHSHFSADSEELPRNHVIEAIAHGLKEICFTEHRDFYFPEMDFSLNLPEYFQEINRLQAEFKDKIKIKIVFKNKKKVKKSSIYYMNRNLLA